MGGCSAPNCSNSSSIGKQLFRFPKDPVRKKIWVVNCRRDFEPTAHSRLCQDHFEQSQFEEIAKSPTGGKKLKPNAIPTLFNEGEPPYPAVSSPFIILPLKSEPVEKDLNFGDHGYARRTPLLAVEKEDAEGTGDDQYHCAQCEFLQKKLEQEVKHTARLQKEAEEMKRRLNRLDRIEKGLQNFLFEDQIRALSLTKRSRRAVWSPETILKARKIRCAIGTKGYEYLREIGYPLPSYRTLCNRLETKIMVTTDMSCEELAELGLGLMATCNSPTEVVGDHSEEEQIAREVHEDPMQWMEPLC
ncbi:THAP domain-containing protein 1 [Nematolebias whitei]|uniref:THAP domain-containing protein 1 n=1 Tax=Nematolebias whitei TaxID=451745 RepID=UPI001896C3CC|nr:THAP domain-containing protein 1 [Nematolebias whitei]